MILDQTDKLIGLITAGLLMIAAWVAYLDHRRKVRREDKASAPSMDECARLRKDFNDHLEEEEEYKLKVRKRFRSHAEYMEENRAKIKRILLYLKKENADL